MTLLLASTALVLVGSMAIGQLVLALCGSTAWSWAAPAVGLAVLVTTAMAVLHTPGHAITVSLVLAALTVGGLALLVRRPELRPPLSGILAALPVAVLALVPFLGAGRAGTLGVGFDNDMALHQAWAESFADPAYVSLLPDDYPVGPHAVAGMLARVLGGDLDLTFAGFTAALPILMAWAALGSLRASGLIRRAAVCTVVALPFMVAGYYGQGSFKELSVALFALGLLALLAQPPTTSVWRWVPVGVLLAGTLSAFSWPGLSWMVAIIGGWLIVSAALDVVRRGTARNALEVARDNLVPVLAAGGVTVLLLIPQIPRLARFAGGASDRFAGQGLGNLAGRIPVWPAFGVWDQPDYRLPAIDPFTVGLWTAFVLGLALFGVVFLLRRGRWLIPMTAVLFFVIWAVADHVQTPYVAAKAIVLLSPMLLLLAILPLVEDDAGGPARSALWRVGAPVVAAVLVLQVVQSSWHALRISRVGPTVLTNELLSLRDGLRGERVLWLGNDDFAPWALLSADLRPVVLGDIQVPTRPEKPWAYGQPIDFDTADPAIYDEVDWVLTPRDPAGSAPPAGLRLVRRTRTFDLYRRVGPVARRSVLPEGASAGAVLKCATPAGRALLRRGGVAATRAPSVAVPVNPIAPGARASVALPLTPGTWDLSMPYESQGALTVTALGRRFTVPGSLGRPGVRLPVGAIRVPRAQDVPVVIEAEKRTLTPKAAVAVPGALIATRRGTTRIVPLRRACGDYVDWFRAPSAAR